MGDTPARSAPVRHIRGWTWVFMGIFLIGIYFFLPRLTEFGHSTTILLGANLWLVGAALLLTTLNAPLETWAQIIAAGGQGKWKDVLLRVIAGEWVLNSFLPVSLGAVTLLADYYHQFIRDRAKAFMIVYIPVIFNTVFSVVFLALASPLTLSHIALQLNSGLAVGWIIAIGGLAVVIGLVFALTHARQLQAGLRRFVAVLTILRNGTVALRLALLSFTVLLLNGIVLWLCSFAVGVPLSLLSAVVLYLSSLLIANVVPIPGGIGAAEATLAVGLAGTGLTLSDSLAIILLFRLVSFWIPIVPGAIALREVNKTSSLLDKHRFMEVS